MRTWPMELRHQGWQTLIFRFTSEKPQQILATDSQLLLAPVESARRRSQIDHALHPLHESRRGVVAHVQDRCDLAWRVVLLWLNLDRPLTHPLLVSMASSVCDQFVDVFIRAAVHR